MKASFQTKWEMTKLTLQTWSLHSLRDFQHCKNHKKWDMHVLAASHPERPPRWHLWKQTRPLYMKGMD